MAEFFQSASLRAAAIGVYRIYARSQFWRSGPRVFVNSIPKAGTHLVTSRLEQIPQLQNSRLWVRKRFINKRTSSGERIRDFEFDREAFERYMATVRGGQFFTGHLQYHPELMAALKSADVRVLFVARHPLDVLVSQFHYIKGLRRHSKHDFFVERLADDEQRIETLIRGRDEAPYMIGMADQLRAYQGWLDRPDVLTLRFEDLVGARGGGDDDVRDATLKEMLAFLGLPPESLPREQKAPSSATFRKGKANTWRELLSAERMARLTEADRQAIAEFGYAVQDEID